jgi:hypothetical protein
LYALASSSGGEALIRYDGRLSLLRDIVDLRLPIDE